MAEGKFRRINFSCGVQTFEPLVMSLIKCTAAVNFQCLAGETKDTARFRLTLQFEILGTPKRQMYF